MLEFDLQHLFIPAGVLCEPVICNNIGPNLIWCQVFKADGWHFCHTEKLCRLYSSVACDDRSGSIDQNRIDKAERLNTIAQLPNLRSRVYPCVVSKWSQRFDFAICDMELSHCFRRCRFRVRWMPSRALLGESPIVVLFNL